MIEESQQGAVAVIGSSDPLTFDHVGDAASVFEKCAAKSPPMAVFDMARVALLDSAGLELLLNAHERFEQRGGALKIAAANALCLEAMTVTGVADQLEIFDEVIPAVRSFLR